jgi:hypothetical protein
MYTDPILDELRKIRDNFAKKYHYDLHELFKTLSQTEKMRIKKEKHLKGTKEHKDGLHFGSGAHLV